VSATTLADANAGPYRSLSMRLLNVAGRIPPLAFSLDPDRLVGKALKASGQRELGSLDAFLREGLARLVTSLETEAHLDNVGRAIAQENIVHALATRLKLEAHWRQHPGVMERPIVAPLFIVGLPRTGTTFLYHLLDQDGALRAPRTWELGCPAAVDRRSPEAQIARTQRWIDRLYGMSPGLQALHKSSATTPEEDFSIFRLDLRSTYFSVFFHVPAYLEWVLGGMEASSFALHRRYLQTLAVAGDGRRWLLKSPEYLFRLRALLETYPDAKIVHCHRDPLAVCASEASLITRLQGIGSAAVDVSAKAGALAAIFARMLDSARRFRAATAAAEAFHDLHFDHLEADPMAALAGVYRHLGIEMSDVARTRLETFVAENPRHRHGTHSYSAMSRASLAPEVESAFRAYTDTFGIRTGA
jgi:LPS sulfotransferase NodH